MSTKFKYNSKPHLVLQVIRSMLDALLFNALLCHKNEMEMQSYLLVEAKDVLSSNREFFNRFLQPEERDELYKRVNEALALFAGFADKKTGCNYTTCKSATTKAKEFIRSFS